jgi:hypothetical protein
VTPEGLERLTRVIAAHWATKYRKVLECAPDVNDAMIAASREPDPIDNVQWGRELVSLLGIEVHVVKALPEGAWSLTRHSACKVTDENRVSHEDCPVIEKGDASG